jgi:hypothetical protein
MNTIIRNALVTGATSGIGQCPGKPAEVADAVCIPDIRLSCLRQWRHDCGRRWPHGSVSNHHSVGQSYPMQEIDESRVVAQRIEPWINIEIRHPT